ncbi:precorrin-3B C(17)-methyltransferase [Paenibacillus filicis]|uniref:Precorrin-3B C(17)-methyltransferase n=1 Tax=Paenibacillus gyeongsangnamensis TaxID=3388067 RepID=A0ABT4QHG7_9BACL|nr:precorrin-3B C(17)-methyltransferase [Paenibacillus filicis]MCZ8516345.1 precorrin-3B C(17)-methyltransferase [Paenibacillus filicis]
MRGRLSVIGFGPGSFEHMTQRAKEAIQESDVVIGYNTYVDLVRGLLNDQQIVRTGMTEEVSRAQEAVRQAEAGKKVAVISSGDAGVYGMAGLVYEVLMEKGWRRGEGVEVDIIPGISAINSTASLLGAPVMHDACTISLSDHLTPWEIIEKRIEAAGAADFVIALYNPRSGKRTRQIVETQRILLKYRSPQTPVGIVKSAYRDREHIVLTTLADMLEHDIGMLTTVVIGNSSTVVYDGLMITPRGYQRKYTLGEETQALKPHERLRPEAEPWALAQEEPHGAAVSAEAEAMVAAAPAAAEVVAAVSEPRRPGPLELALEALSLALGTRGAAEPAVPAAGGGVFRYEEVLEFAVRPGLAEKRLTAAQLAALAEAAGERGSVEYTPHHQLVVRLRTDDKETVLSRLRGQGLMLEPVGDVVQLKACDFCNLEKAESVPYAEKLQAQLGGLKVPKELKIGFNGCGMACYGAVKEDIGIVYRREKFDLFLGGKTVGRTAHAGQPVAEGIPPEELADILNRIVRRYAEEGHPNERFHKYFARVKELEQYRHQDAPVLVSDPAVCGD